MLGIDLDFKLNTHFNLTDLNVHPCTLPLLDSIQYYKASQKVNESRDENSQIKKQLRENI